MQDLPPSGGRPDIGDCDVLDITDRDQRVVIYTAEPGSPSENALQLLSVVGTQRIFDGIVNSP